MTTLVILSVVEIVVLIAGLAFYLFWVGSLLTRIAGNLEECAELVGADQRSRRGNRAWSDAHQPDRGRGGGRAAPSLRDGRGHRRWRHPGS